MRPGSSTSWLRPRIGLTITLPYLVLSVILGLVAVYLVARLEGQTLHAAFQRQLSDAGLRVADTSVLQERDHLEAVRAIAHLGGLPAALAAGDQTRLARLIVPYAANYGLDRVVLLDLQGRPLLAMQASGPAAGDYAFDTPADYSTWPLVRTVLAGRQDSEGDKYIDLTLEGEVWALYTAGPVHDGERHVGVALVGTSLPRLVGRWRDMTFADVTIYSLQGQPLASSLGRASFRPLDRQTLNTVRQMAERRPQRELSVDSRSYGEIIQPLVVRKNQTVGLIGVALPSRGIVQHGNALAVTIIQLFMAGSIAVVIVGVLLTRRFVRPINVLVHAAERVTSGDLSVDLSTRRRDELGHLMGSFNKMVAGLRERERVREIFGRFVSPTIAELVLQRPLQLRGELRTVTVLFTDIRDFTRMAEQQDPIETVDTLNQYFEIIVDVAEQHRGLVNKFGGDSTLVLFGLTEQDAGGRMSARAAVRAAIEIRERILELNRQRRSAGLAPLNVGIGINTGRVVAGLVGAQRRLEYTVIGDPVNLSARIQALSHVLGADILISAETYQALRADVSLLVRDLGIHRVKGKQHRVQLYSVLDWPADEAGSEPVEHYPAAASGAAHSTPREGGAHESDKAFLIDG